MRPVTANPFDKPTKPLSACRPGMRIAICIIAPMKNQAVPCSSRNARPPLVGRRERGGQGGRQRSGRAKGRRAGSRGPGTGGGAQQGVTPLLGW